MLSVSLYPNRASRRVAGTAFLPVGPNELFRPRNLLNPVFYPWPISGRLDFVVSPDPDEKKRERETILRNSPSLKSNSRAKSWLHLHHVPFFSSQATDVDALAVIVTTLLVERLRPYGRFSVNETALEFDSHLDDEAALFRIALPLPQLWDRL